MANITTSSDYNSVAEVLNFDCLTKFFPLRETRKILRQTGKASKRVRDLPAHVMVYYVIAMTIFMGQPYRDVFRELLNGWNGLLKGKSKLKPPSKGSICKARIRLGAEPLREIHNRFVGPVATKETKGAWFKGWRTVGIDGSTLNVADTPGNEEEFERPKSSRGKSAYPKLRFVSLLETGTRVLFGTQIGPINKTSEKDLARKALSFLKPGMLCLADRHYLGYDFLKLALATGADVLWRASSVFKLKPEQYLADGSYLTTIYKSESDRKHKKDGIQVRVVRYRVKGFKDSYRVVTSILDPTQATAEDIAALYHERWEIEIALGELKTRLIGADIILRSQKPELVKQEFYGFLLGYFAVRGIMHEAALQADEDPDRLSFVHSVRVIKRRLPDFAAFSPAA
ncbi:MAG: IS4 family transposase [Ktedonobacteraceae bacterium]